MKKIYLLLAFFAIATIAVNAQGTAYYDAIYLKESISAHGGKFKIGDIRPIAESYFGKLTDHQLDSAIKLNDFLNNYYSGPGVASVNFRGLSVVSSGILNNDISSFADGLTKFLIKRAKEELFISIFSKLQDPNKVPEFNKLFPQTYKIIANFNSWEYSNVTNTLREAFDKDFKALLGNIQELRTLDPNNKSYSKDTKKRVKKLVDFLRTDDGRIVLTALEISNGFITREKIPDVIHKIAGPDYLAGVSTITDHENIINSIKLADILNYSLRSQIANQNYISLSDFTALMADQTSRDLYLGLLWQQIHTEGIKISRVPIDQMFTRSSYGNIVNYFTSLFQASEKLETAIQNLADAKKNGETDLDKYFAAIFENANTTLTKISNFNAINPSINYPAGLQKTFALGTKTLEIAHDISVKNYSAALVGVVTFIDDNVPASANAKPMLQFLVKYGSFAASMVQAKNADDAEQAIEAFALPAGSASIKKKTQWNIALNGYLGGFYGNEYLSKEAIGKWSPISGVYAPVGVTVSKGLGKAGSLSLFVSVIDLGAIASYRLQDTSTEKLPKVTLQNILAPGAGIIYGIPNWPISVGWSWQIGPALREINSSTVTTGELNHRWQFFLAVDIPLLNFYTKSK